MRTTIELPDELLSQAKVRASSAGIPLRQLFIEAVQQRLAPPPVKKVRRPPPEIGSPDAPRIGILTADQIDEALFG
jgi:hypothetical protein